MADLKLVVAGASGRMGRTLIREIAYVHPHQTRELNAARYLNWRINRQVNTEDTALIEGVQAYPHAAVLMNNLAAVLERMADYDAAQAMAERGSHEDSGVAQLNKNLIFRQQPQFSYQLRSYAVANAGFVFNATGAARDKSGPAPRRYPRATARRARHAPASDRPRSAPR